MLKQEKKNRKNNPNLSNDQNFEQRMQLEEKIKEAQGDYDATPAGTLDLERRIGHGERYPEEYQDRLALARAVRKEKLALLKTQDHGDNNTHYDEQKDAGNAGFDTKLMEDNSDRLGFGRSTQLDDREKTLRESLIANSHEWMLRLSPEEMHAVSWLTSNGSSIMTAHLTGQEHEIWGHDVYSKEYLDTMTSLCDSAYEKSPRTQYPVVIYRGLNTDHFHNPNDISIKEVNQMFTLGSTYTAPTYLSATANSNTAEGFASSNIVLEIKTRTIPSPVNVSAWGTSEQEVTIPRNKQFRVTNIIENVGFVSRNLDNNKVYRDNIVVQLEEIE